MFYKYIGGCQRIDTQYFEFLPSQSNVIRRVLTNFVENVILKSFSEDDFVLDVYVENLSKGLVRIVDISELDPRLNSESLLTWDDLSSTADENWPLRFINSDEECRISRLKTKIGPVEFENMNEFDIINGNFNFD